MKNNLPNFLIVGAGKSGSTSLYHYLCQHPDIFMPANKEPNFFVSDYQRKTNVNSPSYKDDKKRMIFELEKYQKLFIDAVDFKLVGEATVTYLYQYQEAVPKIKRMLGSDTKIIIILRNPIERTFSNYAYACELGYETLSYSEALLEEDNRINNNWASIFAYKKQSEYYEQVKAYIENFDNVHIVLMNELQSTPEQVMYKLFEFLDIEPIDIEVNEIFNPTGIPKNRILHDFLNQSSILKDIVSKVASPFVSQAKLQEYARKMRQKNISGRLKNDDKEIEARLHKELDPQIKLLEKLINKDLRNWYID